jgi:hypothetical protein
LNVLVEYHTSDLEVNTISGQAQDYERHDELYDSDGDETLGIDGDMLPPRPPGDPVHRHHIGHGSVLVVVAAVVRMGLGEQNRPFTGLGASEQKRKQRQRLSKEKMKRTTKARALRPSGPS